MQKTSEVITENKNQEKKVQNGSLKLKIYNTLSNSMEDFVPLEPNKLKMYACGITVYDEAHIGHARQAMSFDIIRNYLKYSGYDVTYVRNYTDIDDKIINRAIKEDKECSSISEYYINESKNDLKRIKVNEADVEPKVTEHIPEIIKYIETLITKGYGYVSNGEVLFDVLKVEDYGKLSNRKVEDLISNENSPNKRNQVDFSLRKPAKEGEPSWESPRGKGRPGWHIECSVLANKYLGESIDIHGGGLDIMFPHHENEIAQSEAFSGKQFSKYWVHNGMVNVNGQKMGKSLGNFLTIKDALNDYNADIIRYVILSYNLATPMDFNPEMFKIASKRVYYFYKSLNMIDDFLSQNKDVAGGKDQLIGEQIHNLESDFVNAMNENFNFPKVLGALSNIFSEMNELMTSKKIPDQDKIYTLSSFREKLTKITDVIRIFDDDPKEYVDSYKKNFLKEKNIDDGFITEKINQRNQAKIKKEYTTADQIREELKELGIGLQDKGGETDRDIII
ncbi:MAG: cysteine--tRNA ligase [candidate division SR1 bacterium]|nr:cysteine--tRNA ligase [candidate division SR1 bacterium]